MNALMSGNLTKYTENVNPESSRFLAMRMCLRLTSLATLLIGLQLLSPKMFSTQVATSLLNNNSLNYSLIASNSKAVQGWDLIEQASSEDFIPPDNGHPNNTRGSGTR